MARRERPEPLVPADADMGGNTWFKLHLDRLDRSRWWARADHVARSINVDLWKAAYREIPAGSLIDDDVDLARHAGFGRDLKAWQEVKQAVMEPWILCNDGRWYHPTLCEQVIEALDSRTVRRKTETARKAEYRRRMRAMSHGTDVDVPPEKGHVPRDSGTNVPDLGGCPAYGVPQEENRGEEKRGEDSAEAESGDQLPLIDPAGVDSVRQAVEDWNVMAARAGLPRVKRLNDGRREKLKARLKADGLIGWREALVTVEHSRFLRGLEGRGSWKADFDFLLQESSFQKVIEGKWPRDLVDGEANGTGLGASAGGRGNAPYDRLRDVHEAALEGLRRLD